MSEEENRRRMLPAAGTATSAGGRSNRERRMSSADQQQLASYDPLIRQRQQLNQLRGAERQRLDDLIGLYESEPDRLREAQGVATNEMRRAAALRMGAQGLRGNVIGAMSAAKGVGQEAENIGTRFGAQIRDAARTAAQARVEKAQQAIESIAKPGVDVERISASLGDIIERTKQSFGNRARQVFSRDGGVDSDANFALRDAELKRLLETTDDPLAVQLIQRVQSNIAAGRDPLDGMASV